MSGADKNTSGNILLDVEKLGISFGGLKAVDNFNLKIEKGELYGLIGPNGAGKTTIFNLLTGVYKPDTGRIILDGADITGKPTIEINKAGIARTFQNIRLFSNLPVIDNVKAALHNHYRYGLIHGIFRVPQGKLPGDTHNYIERYGKDHIIAERNQESLHERAHISCLEPDLTD